MNYIHKTLLLLCLSVIILKSYAQVGSPYSQFGIGDNISEASEQSKAMGGIGIGLQANNQLNRLNPASFARLDSLTVIYSIGVNAGFNNIQSSDSKLKKNDARFGYFTLGFKGNRYWGSCFGLAPFSRANYTYKYSETNPENGQVDYYFHGSGGLNKVFWDNSFKITPNLSLGISASYLFGAIDKVSTVIFANDWALATNTKVDRQLNVYDFLFKYGLQYKFKLKEKSNLVMGAVYENKMNLNTKQSIKAGTVANSVSLESDFYNDIFAGEKLLVVAIDTSNMKGSIDFPQAFGLGFTYDYNRKLLFGIDYYQQMWRSVTNDIYNASQKDLISVKGGLEFTPDFNNINYYYKRMNYRIGAHYTQTQLEIKGTRVDDYGFSFGLGLPMRGSLSNFNLSFELGRRGTLEQNLLQETYGILSLNLSLSDIWFVKRKFK